MVKDWGRPDWRCKIGLHWWINRRSEPIYDGYLLDYRTGYWHQLPLVDHDVCVVCGCERRVPCSEQQRPDAPFFTVKALVNELRQALARLCRKWRAPESEGVMGHIQR